MSLQPELLDRLGDALEYPRAGYAERAARCAEVVAAACPEAGAELEGFVELVRATPLDGLEELYTRTFEINPECCLEVGWQIYGEQYQRGVFLVRMRELVRTLGIVESGELPDHLTHMLPVLGRVDDRDAALLAERYVGPAVERMAEALERAGSPYLPVLRAVSLLLALLATESLEVPS